MLKADEMKGSGVDLSGYRLSEGLLEALKQAKPGSPERLRTVRLQSDRNEADLKVEGAALWRRSEPANAPELAAALAADISDWVQACAVS